MFVYIWQYRVRPDSVERFRQLYAPGGKWTRLFAGSEGYVGTTLLRDASDEHVFATIDRWETRAHHAAFLDEHGAEFRALDSVCEELTEWERRVGSFLSEDA